ncbi:unnamed protein product [Anisakis simplex]|uniref:Protein kinase domain-containing protein n=1 Tax=Anisakis simplex TaxID=6269 RepID=A0A0M3KIB2_ANISI|nr:unnamed protein product [Anisakis simplex]
MGPYSCGDLYRGKLTKGILNKDVTVAVETFRPETRMDPDSKIKFLRESNQMLALKHKNVIRLYGVCTQKLPILIVREFAPGGSLLDRIRNLEVALSLEDKQRYCRHIAYGMEYLSNERVHFPDLSHISRPL